MRNSDANLVGLGWRIRFADWIGRFLLPPGTFATAVTGAMLTFNWGNAAKEHPGLSTIMAIAQAWDLPAFLLFAIATFAAASIQGVVRPSLRKLQEKVDLVGESFRTLCDGLMVDLSNKLAIAAGEQSRTSIYIHDGDQSFVLCGRYAPDPVLKRPGRPSYPDNQGCIGAAWRNGWQFENDLGESPHYESNTEARYNIAAEELAKIPMHSEMFGVQRIDVGPEFVGIVVVESMRRDRFDEPSLRAELSQFANDYGTMLKAFRGYIPIPSAAKARGF